MADWKKRLLRVKQKAGQTLGGAEKTEVLTDDLHSLEKWVEQVKSVCHNSHKRVKECLHTSTSTDKEKKLKKLPEFMLAAQLSEASTSLTQIKEDTLMGQLMKTCGDAQAALASECVEYEAGVETGVLAPLHQLTEQDIPAIQKTRRNLSKLVLDMDMAKTKYHSAVKQQSVGNMPHGKVEAIKEELEDTQSKVQSCKDQLSTDMYKFAASEQDYSRFLLTLVEAQASYHRNALKHLESIIPDMQKVCDCHTQTPVYGTPLEEHLRRVNREIATVLEDCIVTLAEFGLDEEGLFRIAGGASKVKKLKAAFDAGLVDMEDFLSDIHSVAGAMKLYLRELPEPLMTYQLYDEWMAAAHLGHEERMQKLWLLCDRLPKINFDNLRYLIKFLAKLSENSEVNKMSPSNIAIVIGPNLIWPPGDGGPSVLTTTTQSAIVESLIQHANYFFPGDVSFSYSDIRTPSPSPKTIQRRYTSPALTKSSPTNGTTLAVHDPHHAPVSRPTFKIPSPSFIHRPIAIFAPNNDKKTLLELASPKQSRKAILNISAPIPQNQTTPTKFRSPSSEAEDRQSIDSGIGSSGSTSRKTSLKGQSRFPRDSNTSPEWKSPSGSTRPSIILETSPKEESPSNVNNSNFLSHDDVFLEHNLALCPPVEIIESKTPPLKANPPRSVHSDMYDTVFALQALGNGWSDYLTKVRGLWDGHMETNSNKRLSFNGKEDEELSPEEKRSSLRNRTRASSESRLLEVPLKEDADSKKDRSLTTMAQIPRDTATPKLTKNRASFGALPTINDISPIVTSQSRYSSATSNQKPALAGKPPHKLIRRSTEPSLTNPAVLPARPKSVLPLSAEQQQGQFSINRGSEQQGEVSTKRDIQFGLGSASDKGTPPGTLNAAPPGLYPNLEDLPVATAPSLSPSGSDHALHPDGTAGGVMAGVSPRAARKNKRAAPPPPGGEKPLRTNVPSPLVNLDKPPTSEKPQVSPAGHRSPAYADRLNQPERPLVPPPAPPKPTSPGAISTGSVGYEPNTGTGNAQAPLPSPARPNKPPPPVLHEKPVSMHTELHNKLGGAGTVLVDKRVSTSTVPGHASASTNITPAYDNVTSLPYGPKPPEATSAVIDSASPATNISNECSVSASAQLNSSAPNGTSGSSGKSNSLPRNSNSLPRNGSKPPRPPRPVTMVSKEGKSTDNEITESTEGTSANSEKKKPSVSEETHL